MKSKIEKLFENLAEFIFTNAKWMFALTIGVTIFFGSFAPFLPQDFKVESVLHKKDESILKYNSFRSMFGRDEIIILGIETSNVFDDNFIQKLKSLHQTLEKKVPHLDKVISLLNVRSVRGDKNDLIVENLFENYPESDSLEAIKQKVANNPLYRNYLINDNATFTAIIIKTDAYSSNQSSDDESGFFDDIDEVMLSGVKEKPKKYLTEKENDEIVIAVKAISDQFNSETFKTFLAGFPVYDHFLNKVTISDTQTFMGLGFLVCVIVLWILFRRMSGVVYPLLIVIFSALVTFGIMVLIGGVFKVPTQILPNFIFAVGIGASVHILSIFYQKFRESGDKKESIVFAMGHSGIPVLLTSLTTIGGVLSLCTSSVAPISDLGIYMAIGITLCFIFTIFLIPELIALFPMKQTELTEKKEIQSKILEKISEISIHHPYSVIMVCAALTLLSVSGISKLQFGYHPMSWFPENYHLRIATNKIDKELNGTMTFEVLIESDGEDILYNPVFMKKLDALQDYLAHLKFGEVFVGKTWAATDVIKEVNQALQENNPAYHIIPESTEALTQEFFLFESSGFDDLKDLTSNFKNARLTIKVPDVDSRFYMGFLNDLNRHLKEVFPEYKTTITGIPTILFRTLMFSGKTMAESYIIAIIVISFLMVILLGNIRIGLLSMVPNIFPIMLCFGILGFFDIKLNLFIILTGSIVLGIAVDDTIHFMHNFKKYLIKNGSAQYAIKQTIMTSGHAMFVTSCVLSLSFLSLTLSCMSNIRILGMILGYTIIGALLSDFLLSPALLILTYRWFKVVSISDNNDSQPVEGDKDFIEGVEVTL